MRRIKLIEPGRLELQTIDEHFEVTENTVKVTVKACGICGSDLSLYKGSRDISKETYFGHEFSGVITDAGAGTNGLKTGMRVASELVKSCGKCWYCRNGLENYCKSMNYALLPGGFTEETLVTNTDEYGFLSPIPDELDDITAALMEPANCAFRIAMKAGVKPGDTVVVFGLGAMGLFSAMIMKTLGAGKIVFANRDGQRLRNVRDTGLFDVVSTSREGWQDEIREIIGEKGADVVVEATGASQVLKDTFGVVRWGGKIVIGSVYSGLIDGFDPLPIFRKELTIVGAKGPYPQVKSSGQSAVVDKLVQLKDDLRKVITVYDYKDALEAFEDAKSGKAVKAVIKF
ncbi:MAG: alcohol dehydrogenase catalytic domain-containing protein [Lachnospiraceae bacterium]|nr:alcohol dehydrogenase catalytic domain-containing protein [Lachnospiraceae bacterium]